MFSTHLKTEIIILTTFILSSANAFSSKQTVILSFSKELKLLSASVDKPNLVDFVDRDREIQNGLEKVFFPSHKYCRNHLVLKDKALYHNDNPSPPS